MLGTAGTNSLPWQQRCYIKIATTIDVYVDEAGDLGFSQSSTKYFIIAYLIVEHPNRVGTEVKRLLKTLNKKNRKKLNEFKFGEDEGCLHNFI